MRDECKHLRGRKLDQCEGRGHNGRSNPLQSDCDAYRESWGLPPIVVQEPQAKQIYSETPQCKQVSQIGTNLAAIFAEEVGAIPCGECKGAIRNLNSLTTAEVRNRRGEIVSAIAGRAKSAAPTFFTKLVVAADQFLSIGGTEFMIGLWLDRACNMESKCRVKKR